MDRAKQIKKFESLGGQGEFLMSGGGCIEHLPTGSLKLSHTPITCHSHAQSVSVKVLTESGVHGFFNTHYFLLLLPL